MNIAVIISSLLSGVLGSMGFGGGTVLILYLTLVAGTEQKQAQGINLVFFLPCAVLSVIYYSKKGIINIKQILPYVFFGITGALFGYTLLDKIPSAFLSKAFGVFLIFLGLKDLFLLKKNKSRSK